MNPVSLQLPLRANDTVLRLLRETDLPAFHAYRSDAALAVYQGWSPMSEAAALGFIQAMSGVSALVAGDWIQLGIADGRTDALAGDLGLYLDADGMAAEIGFTLASAHQGRGHATRAVAAALVLVFSSTRVQQVRAVTDARNQRSVRVLERAGFAKVGEREAIFKGEPCTEHVYVRLRGQAGWPPSKTSSRRSADHRR